MSPNRADSAPSSSRILIMCHPVTEVTRIVEWLDVPVFLPSPKVCVVRAADVQIRHHGEHIASRLSVRLPHRVAVQSFLGKPVVCGFSHTRQQRRVDVKVRRRAINPMQVCGRRQVDSGMRLGHAAVDRRHFLAPSLSNVGHAVCAGIVMSVVRCEGLHAKSVLAVRVLPCYGVRFGCFGMWAEVILAGRANQVR